MINKVLAFSNMRPFGAMWKLGFLFSIIFISFPIYLFGSETPTSEIVVHADSIFEDVKIAHPSLYVSEGTIIYGMENISVKEDTILTVKKSIAKKEVSKKDSILGNSINNHKKQKQKVEIPEALEHLSSHQSENLFHSSNQQFGVGTLIVNNFHKSAVVNDSTVILNYIYGSIHTLCDYSHSFINSKARFFSFTRPPPFA